LANIKIFDVLGNIVFSTTAMETQALRLYDGTIFCRDAMLASPTATTRHGVVWNLRNPAGRLVANGAYLIIVEATTICGRRFTYSSRVGVKR